MPVSAPSRGRALRAGLLLIACALALAACKKGGEGEAMAKGKDGIDKGPEAVPADLPSCSTLERIELTLMPEPEPPLKIMPSSTYQLRIEGMVSSTAKMKQALACCERSGAPMLNQTGLLKAARWVARMYLSSSRKSSASVSLLK